MFIAFWLEVLCTPTGGHTYLHRYRYRYIFLYYFKHAPLHYVILHAAVIYITHYTLSINFGFFHDLFSFVSPVFHYLSLCCNKYIYRYGYTYIDIDIEIWIWI